MSVVLEPMSRTEFETRIAALRSRYAGNLHRERGMSPAEAEAEASEKLDVILPKGYDSELTILRTARVGGDVVGWVWVTLPGAPGRPEMAWVHNIDVDPAFQSRGYGRGILLAIEEELRGQGVDRLGLNVFGGNTRAIRLYESLGFGVMAQQMAKSL
ncbi:GNAT family N-acetyltransferase [Actinoplanes sp. NPDC051851]|uniref:GNAT family N-acetyltransferase n=1 Tax=Actinoplanes sp. NPDC051851 TaxID=3154753 RepID=UPI0034145F9B